MPDAGAEPSSVEAGVSHHPADVLADALESDEVTDSEFEAVDNALEHMILGEALPEVKIVKSKALISLDQAHAKLSPEILKALIDKFKGSLTQVRQLDERDQIF